MNIVKGLAFIFVAMVFTAVAGESGIAICQAGYALDMLLMFTSLVFGVGLFKMGSRRCRWAIADRRDRRKQALEPSWSQRLQEEYRGD